MKNIIIALILIFLASVIYGAVTDNVFNANIKLNNCIVAIPSSALSTMSIVKPILYNASTCANITSGLFYIQVPTQQVIACKTACATASIVLTPKSNPTATMTATVIQ